MSKLCSASPLPSWTEFRDWFVELDAAAWDGRIEEDIAAGRLNALADEAIGDLHTGRCTER